MQSEKAWHTNDWHIYRCVNLLIVVTEWFAQDSQTLKDNPTLPYRHVDAPEAKIQLRHDMELVETTRVCWGNINLPDLNKARISVVRGPVFGVACKK